MSVKGKPRYYRTRDGRNVTIRRTPDGLVMVDRKGNITPIRSFAL